MSRAALVPQRLNPPSSGRPNVCFAPFAPPLMSSVRSLMLRAAVLLFACFLGGTSEAQDALVMGRVVLLQPDSVMRARLPSAASLATYIKALEAAASKVVAAADDRPLAAGFLVIAVRPGAKSNAWLDFTPTLSKALELALVAGLEAVPPLPVTGGLVVFAVQVGAWGAVLSPEQTFFPAAWKVVVQQAGKNLEASELAELAWHER